MSPISTGLLGPDGVAEGAQTGDRALDGITRHEEPGRVETDADTRRGAGGDDVPGQQGDPPEITLISSGMSKIRPATDAF
jgi:hypothetical protein